MATEDSTVDALARRVGRVVQAQRLAQGQSLGDLSRASGLSKTILARIERGEGNPSMETLWKLSQALVLPLGALLAEDTAPRVRLIPAESGDELHGDAGTRAWLIHADGTPRRTEVMTLALPPNVDRRGEPHLPGTEELVVCIEGAMRVGPLDDEVELRTGDAAWFVADGPHRYEARGKGARALNWMLYA